MVKLEELEDEHFLEKPAATNDNSLLADDDDDYTDTDSEISDTSDLGSSIDESLYDRILALKDILPPKTRARITTVSSSIYNTTATGVTYSGKGLWIIATSILLLGLPYALALGDEQQIQEEERRAAMMAEGAQGLMDASDGQSAGGDVKPSL